MINYLSSLSIDGYDIDFNKFKFEYTIDVPKDVTRLEINAVANSETGKVVISKNAQELINSTNEIEVDVIDNDFITTYVIKVNKEEDTPKPGPMLNNIMIDGKIIDNFSSNNFSYVVTVDYGVKKLDIQTNSDDNIKVSIVGNDNLKNNSVIYIYASNEEFANTYILNIKQLSFVKTYSYYIYFGCLFIFCLIVYFVVKVKREKSKNVEDKKIKVEKKPKEKIKKEKKPKNKKVKKEKKIENEEIERL